jgi:ATP-dependent DNA helicase RecG
MIDLTEEQAEPRIKILLSSSESRTLDFKRVSGKMVGKALETLCAFANTEGGILVLGVADERQEKGSARFYGTQENPEALDELTRKVRTQFHPAIDAIRFVRLPCILRDGSAGHLVLVQAMKSDKVHSIVDDGTWTRLDAGNREMTAAESTELSYRRGVRSAESEPVSVPLSLLETDTWRSFVAARGLRSGSFAEQLQRIGLAVQVGSDVLPTRAAVLLFAEEPGGLLAAHGSRADIRLMVYDGKQAVPGATPNLRKTPKSIRGPLIEQIDAAVKAVLDELAQGLTLSGSGFKTQHLYPERVVKEAIVNAVIHRDYRLNRDMFIRLFDDRIEVESPGVFPGKITPANVVRLVQKHVIR